MGRRSGFGGFLAAVARDAARAHRQAEVAQRRQAQERIRAARLVEADQKRGAKEARLQYLEDRKDEAEQLNKELISRIADLSAVLEATFEIDDSVPFSSLRITDQFRPFQVRAELSIPTRTPDKDAMVRSVKAPTGLMKLVPGAQDRYARELQAKTAQYEAALRQCQAAEADRLATLAKMKETYDQERALFEAKLNQRNQEVDEFEAAYSQADPGAVASYSTMVLERSRYPEEFPQEFRVAYSPDSKQLAIEYELPRPSIIPTTADYKYNKATDSIDEKPRKSSDLKDLYQDIVAAIALRTVHEVFEADHGNHVDVAVFNGFVQTVDPATGRDIRPCLLSVRATKGRFAELDLRRIDKRACLRNLGAQVSPRPFDVQPVKPIIEFDMVDRRFVEQSDVLADLESRPNLMDLNPFEFENLVSNLFQQMGLETKQTRSSRDGGVDAVAFDARPVLGGKVVIQAKRYKGTVGVAAVRDLFGTMMNEGANKGILVATSGYGPDAFEFAKDKPIELIDGGGLLFLLEQVGVKARIVFPSDTPA